MVSHFVSSVGGGLDVVLLLLVFDHAGRRCGRGWGGGVVGGRCCSVIVYWARWMDDIYIKYD